METTKNTMEIINDEYWLKYAKTSVENSITARNDAAAKLEKMVLWFWSLYTASFTIGITINLLAAPVWVLSLLASPIVLLIITYWLCVWAQLPVTATYDPRIPSEIQTGYNQGLKIKNNRFHLALLLTFLSALLLAIALFSLSFVHKKENYVINAFYNDNKSCIIISGSLPKNTIVNTSLDSIDNKNIKVGFFSNTYKIQENGILNINVPIKNPPREIIVSTTWKDSDIEKGFIQKVKK